VTFLFTRARTPPFNLQGEENVTPRTRTEPSVDFLEQARGIDSRHSVPSVQRLSDNQNPPRYLLSYRLSLMNSTPKFHQSTSNVTQGGPRLAV